jgi:F0F1-type ATP synthase assembly protein I
MMCPTGGLLGSIRVSLRIGVSWESRVVDQRESQSLLSVGIALASRITTIALELSVPVAVGFGLDRWYSTSPWATILGALLGFVLFMLHTVRIASEFTRESNRPGAGLDEDHGPAGPGGPEGSG